MYRDSTDECLNSCIMFYFIFMFIEQYISIAILATRCTHI